MSSPSGMFKLFYWVLGERSSFPIDISLERTVGDLTKAIIADDPIRFSGLSAHQLELRLANIPDTVKGMQEFDFENAKELRGSDEINEYFQVNPVKSKIHIAVKTPGLSQSDFLKLLPPTPDYIINRKKSKAATISTYARTPQSITTWDEFVGDVNNTIWDSTPKYSPPVFKQYSNICNEADVQAALQGNVLLALDNLLPDGEIFTRHDSFPGVVGEPDFILQYKDEALYLAIEVKTKWVLSVDNIVTAYSDNDNPRGINQVKQIFGYLSHNKLRFGALTTYDKTWFIYRPPENPGQLCISPVIHFDNQEPTLFQCFFHLASLAHTASECPTAPPSPPLSPLSSEDSPLDNIDRDPSYVDGGNGDSPHNDGRQKQKPSGQNPEWRNRKRVETGGGSGETTRPSHPLNGLEFFDWGSFKTLDVLGSGRSGTVFEAILRGQVVALKLCDLWQHPDLEKELLNEVEVYRALKDLQGSCIPRLRGAGYTAGGLFAIATDIVGTPLGDVESLSIQERRVIQRALSSIHQYGFVHEDIRKDNILVKGSGCDFEVFFIDFALSKQGCQRDSKKEKKLLAGLLDGVWED